MDWDIVTVKMIITLNVQNVRASENQLSIELLKEIKKKLYNLRRVTYSNLFLIRKVWAIFILYNKQISIYRPIYPLYLSTVFKVCDCEKKTLILDLI